MALIKLAVLLVLLVLAFQDLKSQLVYAYLFPLLAILLVLLRWLDNESIGLMLRDSLYPLSFLLLQLLLLSVYFSLKTGAWVNITTQLLGWGDILLLVSLCFYLSFFNFILFYLLSALLTLIGWGLWKALTANTNRRIPLAGLQALLFAGIFMLSWARPDMNLQNDHWLLNLTGW